MTQFDVHINIGKHRESIPYVVIVQSSLFDSDRRRVVVRLVRSGRRDNTTTLASSSLNRSFTVKGIEVVLHPLEIVSVATEQLGEKIASLAKEGDRITGAMDELFTRAWA